jgi:membrane associated rhomboid family serine protease
VNEPTPPSDLIGWLFTPEGKAAIAGAAGGIVRWVTLREHWKDGLLSLLVGAICAIYLGPLVAPLIEPVVGKIAPESDGAGFSSFVVGLGGISLSGFLIDLIRARRAETKGRRNDPRGQK